ncbi:GIY-YIG nuclease family protein [Nodosilinea sp. E11]|uniref:GIY-YIG nuclease family protein n=1 Tax=Nodosilinea sp. E11 TaxID=3037479 RepID=UPI002934427D|nr:GIY-YIG nuclease family protein [Nodosilinea sp. E11]WOD38085.1 GIY-YIG nuclease family protein [Nodosilinea sp. E11]
MPFTSMNINSVPETDGIYVIYDEASADLPAYIGKSNNIRRRLIEHFIGRGRKTIDLFTDQGHNLWFSFDYSNNPYGARAVALAKLSPAGQKKRKIQYLEDL